MNHLASANNKPINKKVIWVIEFEPANEYQEDVSSWFIEECLFTIECIIPRKHKNNILNIVRKVKTHDGKTLIHKQ